MTRRLLPFILIVALVLRLGFALTLDPTQPYTSAGGDTPWYLANAYALVAGLPSGSRVNGLITDVSALGQPPVYFIITGLPQVLSSQPPQVALNSGFLGWHLNVTSSSPQAIIIIRIIQAFLSAAICYFAYRMAYVVCGVNPSSPAPSPSGRREDTRTGGSEAPLPQGEGARTSFAGVRARVAGLIAAAALAFSPVFILEAVDIKTETAYIFFVAGGLWCFVEALARENRRNAFLVGAGVLLGLATLTRAVFLLFPLALAVWLLVVRVRWRRAALMLVVYMLVVLTWTVYNYARWERWVVAGTGLDAFIYIGATGWDDPQEVDQRLLAAQPSPKSADEEVLTQPDFTQAASNAIMSDIPGYIRHRLGELVSAYLQPHGTLFFPGESLRELAAHWLRDDRSLNGLITLTQGNSFWQKLLVYALHYFALIVGLVGMWRTRRNWRISLPLIGFIVYTTLIHLVLYALPRYLFPTMVFWWVFAAAGMVKRSNE
jgi:hypothetical protein